MIGTNNLRRGRRKTGTERFLLDTGTCSNPRRNRARQSRPRRTIHTPANLRTIRNGRTGNPIRCRLAVETAG